jgi:hypothetical protein
MVAGRMMPISTLLPLDYNGGPSFHWLVIGARRNIAGRGATIA